MDPRHARIVSRVLAWYDREARDLPWRDPEASAWAVLVSEVMLQQTPVVRVLPAWRAWMQQWPTPADLAQAPVADVLRAWDRLGYPRRALRLREAAQAIVDRHGGVVPCDLAELRALPGVGEYTAAAVASFGYGQRHVVLDTNVRRVLGRLDAASALPSASVTRAERERAAEFLPRDPERAARWNVAAMELGALICKAAAPRCADCPVQADCAWLELGRPAAEEPRRVQAFRGTDRQCRGRIMALARAGGCSVQDALALEATPGQGARCVDSLVADGLIVVDDERIRLP